VFGLLGELRRGVSLQYADDTLLFSTPENETLRNLKGVLMIFEQVSGMRINFHKSEVIPLNLEEDVVNEISHILACPVGALPFRYLVVPLHFEKLKREDLQPILDKLIKRCAGWRGRLLVCSSRLVLILVYLLSFMKFSKWAIKLLESQMAHCLWNDGENSNKYHLASWRHVTMKRNMGHWCS
jgi:hypothetical protein